jgi:hypothetical protein
MNRKSVGARDYQSGALNDLVDFLVNHKSSALYAALITPPKNAKNNASKSYSRDAIYHQIAQMSLRAIQHVFSHIYGRSLEYLEIQRVYVAGHPLTACEQCQQHLTTLVKNYKILRDEFAEMKSDGLTMLCGFVYGGLDLLAGNRSMDEKLVKLWTHPTNETYLKCAAEQYYASLFRRDYDPDFPKDATLKAFMNPLYMNKLVRNVEALAPRRSNKKMLIALALLIILAAFALIVFLYYSYFRK